VSITHLCTNNGLVLLTRGRADHLKATFSQFNYTAVVTYLQF